MFSEIYYPDGWIAKVDGKEYPILKVNYLLRGLELPKGKHKIEFTYSSETYETSNMYSMIGSVILILGLLFFTYHYVMERRKVDLEPVKEETQE